MSAIFGGSKSKNTQKSESKNLAYEPINKAFMPGATSAFQAGAGGLEKALAGGYDEYAKNTGLDFWERLGLRKTAGSFSGRGLYNTGATLKALQSHGMGLRTANYNDYLAQQAKLAGLGLQGAGLVSGAGGVSTAEGTSTSSSSPGLAGFAGGILSSAAAGPGGFLTKLASDERLKTNITQVGEYAGLGLYNYYYISGQGPYVGVMAQEVEKLYPEAVELHDTGYLVVDYDKLQEMTGDIKYG